MANGKLMIVGGGMAAGRLLGELTGLGVEREITLISAEREHPYNRVLLPDVLVGTCAPELLAMHPAAWYRDRNITFIGGDAVAELSAEENRLRLTSGKTLVFDELVLATGAKVPLPDISGLSLAGVTALRNLADTRSLGPLAEDGARITVVGGGLLGLEAARALAAIGARVRVIHRGNWLLNRQLDRAGAEIVQAFFETLGIECLLARSVAALAGEGRVRALRLTSGEQLATDVVLFATGTRPDDELAARAGIAVDHGVLVDDRMRSSRENVFAIGECARVADDAGAHSYAMVEPVFEQARVLAHTLGGQSERFLPPSPATRLKVAGLTVFSAGQIDEQPGPDDIVIQDPARRIYRRLRFNQGSLIGAVLIGDSSGSRAIQACLANGGSADDPMALAFGTFEAAA